MRTGHYKDLSVVCNENFYALDKITISKTVQQILFFSVLFHYARLSTFLLLNFQ